MKKIILASLMLCLFALSASAAPDEKPSETPTVPTPSSTVAAPAATPAPNSRTVEKPAVKSGPTPILVAYFSPNAKTQFDSKIKPQFAKQTSLCGTCQIVDLTPFDEKGEFAPEKMESVLKQLPENVKILFFDFNLKRGSLSDAAMALLNQDAAKGPLVIAFAGLPKSNEASRPLNKTVFGQVQDALIIGELEDRDRLSPQGFFGPEMYTAIRAPKELQGQELGPLLFTSKLAANYSRRPASDWVAYFKAKKTKNRKIWLELGDLF
jgi:hypothetical protein